MSDHEAKARSAMSENDDHLKLQLDQTRERSAFLDRAYDGLIILTNKMADEIAAKDARIAELETELKQERLWKLTPDEHRDYLEARYKSVSHDLEEARGRIGELEHDVTRQMAIANEHVNDNVAKRLHIAKLEAALKPFARETLTSEPGHNRTRLFSFEDYDAKIQAARDALEGK